MCVRARAAGAIRKMAIDMTASATANVGMDTALFRPATSRRPARVGMIAELGVNHDGSEARALSLVDAAHEAGADAVKVQWFVPDRLLSNQALLASYQEAQATDPRQMLEALMLSTASMRRVRERAAARGLHFIVTLFSPDDAEAVATMRPDAVKIASPDAVNPPVLDAARGLGLPLLVSTGTCTLAELAPTARLLRHHEPGACLLQCVSSYPAPDDQAALAGIAALAERFNLPAGYSDHTTDPLTGALAVAAGAVVVEKHLTYDKSAPGPDHAASFEPAELAAYIGHIRQAARMRGALGKHVQPTEADVARVARQSVCAVRELPAGHVLQRADLTVKRPGTGIPARRLEELVGRRLRRAVRANDLLAEADIAATMSAA